MTRSRHIRAPRDMPLPERLDRASEPRVVGRCQLWLSGLDKNGYGVLRWKGQAIKTHRATWECEVGPIPEGMCVLHTCDTPPCRNIDHLFLGTNLDNVRDRDTKGRQARQKGEACGKAKLTDAEVLDIRAIPPDVPQRVIGAMYGVSQFAVSAIRSGRRWSHLEA